MTAAGQSRFFVPMPLGGLWVAAQQGRLLDVRLQPDDRIPPGEVLLAADFALHDQLKAQVASYFAGTLRNFSLPLHLSSLPPFTCAVLQCLAQVPYGTTCSYAELAAQAGSPRAARAVGQVMARNPFPLILPCHRVVGSSGRMVGYSGGAGIDTKVWLLQFERRHLG